jgi:hypothetical protein
MAGARMLFEGGNALAAVAVAGNFPCQVPAVSAS